MRVVPRATEIAGFRVQRQHLQARLPAAGLAQAVRDSGGLQAQVTSCAETALWARVEGIAKADVERALWVDRSLVRTWCMRGTAHVLAAPDVPIYLAALRSGVLREQQRWTTRAGLDAGESERAANLIAGSLEDGPLTRREIAERVVDRADSNESGLRRWIEHSLGGIIKQAAIRGLVCCGPPRGRETTFVRLDQWLGGVALPPESEAQQVLFRRYVRTYGPTTVRNFAYWAGIRVSEAATVRERLGDQVVDAGEGIGLLLAEDAGTRLAEPLKSDHTRLLDSFDPYMLGHADKGHLVDSAHYKRVYRKAGWISPVVLVAGRVAGVWSSKRSGQRLRMTVATFHTVSSRTRKRIEAEANRLGRFRGLEAEVAHE